MGNQDNSVDEETLNNATLNGGNSQVDLSTTINADDDAKLVRYKQQLQGSAKAATEANERAKNLEAKLAQEKQKLVKKEYNRIYRNDSLDIEALQALNSEDPELAQDLAKQFQIGGKQVEKIEELFEAFGVGKSKTS